MKNYCLSIICLIAAWIACLADAQEINTNYWNPDTKRLDLSAKHISDPEWRDATITLERDLTRFYQLLRDKQWHETYKLRAKAYRHDVPERHYIAQAKLFGKEWGLANYDVLAVRFENAVNETNIGQAVLICKFVELPGYVTSYATVYWHREDGIWKCMSAGPSNLPICSGTRPPFMDWQ